MSPGPSSIRSTNARDVSWEGSMDRAMGSLAVVLEETLEMESSRGSRTELNLLRKFVEGWLSRKTISHCLHLRHLSPAHLFKFASDLPSALCLISGIMFTRASLVALS
jgi:hypothetical protein